MSPSRILHTDRAEQPSIGSRVEKSLHVMSLLSSCSNPHALSHTSGNRDYRGLKVQLGIIRGLALQPVGATDVGHTHHPAPNNEEGYDDSKGESTLEDRFCP